MNDKNLMILGGMVGAAVGVAVGFALFTERGRQLRAQLQPEIETIIHEAVRLTQMVDEFKAGRPLTQAAAGATAWAKRAT